MMNPNASFGIKNGSSQQAGHVTGAIKQASLRTGVDFDYLVKQAKVESSLNPNAKARTSSATGLFQFIEQTWLRMVKQHGASHGYDKYAAAIKQNRDGDMSVPNRATREAILNLRKDPKAASLMAAELASENNQYLKDRVGVEPNSTDLYLAHFMGKNGAANFLQSMKRNPWAPAASIFPDAARANRNVFYENGKPLSLQAIYKRFEGKFEGAGNNPVQTAATPAVTATETGEVVLPQANSWSRPNSVAKRIERMTAETTRALMGADDAAGSVNGGFGRMPRGAADVLFMAQETMRFEHNDRRRYNA